jgi:hypothetical protein
MLTPEQIEKLTPNNRGRAVIETLTAYAEIVRGVAEKRPVLVDDWNMLWGCPGCGAEGPGGDEIDHAPDCLWLRARRLRGMDA